MGDETRLGPARLAAIVGMSAMTLGVGLGCSGRLTYHEAIWAQSARELLARGDLLVPTLDGRPWLEKPPLLTWLIALSGGLAGRIDETVARMPAVVAATVMAIGVAVMAARRFGRDRGTLAGLIQVTTLWTVMRGRLAEADILLACLTTWALVVFDGLRLLNNAPPPYQLDKGGLRTPWARRLPWLFFTLIGATALAKGIGFGAVLVLATVALTLVWDRDWQSLRRLIVSPGWLVAALVGLAWPLLVLARAPAAWDVWTLHVTDRLGTRSAHFASELWWEYALSPLVQTLPWTPLALAGMRTLRRDRLLISWAIAPAVLVSLASVRNAHYLIYALPPWSMAAAVGLGRLAEWLRDRGWQASEIRTAAAGGFLVLGLACALGFTLLGPPFDRRGVEWSFYASVGRRLAPEEPLVILYDDLDRNPYPSPFGPMPHDLPVRLFYLDRPASWRPSPEALAEHHPPCPFAVLARARDLPALARLGHVERLAPGPPVRRDRTYVLYRIRPRVHRDLNAAKMADVGHLNGVR
jgi:4-amino-4-deoxy-L-arabinose transferase-like glycosyltransferase